MFVLQPVRNQGESLFDYYKNYFGACSLSEMTTEAKDEFYLRLLIQYRGESVEDYITRIDYLFDNVYNEFDIRTDATFANLLTHYYRYANIAYSIYFFQMMYFYKRIKFILNIRPPMSFISTR